MGQVSPRNTTATPLPFLREMWGSVVAPRATTAAPGPELKYPKGRTREGESSMFEPTLIEGRQLAEAQGLPARQGRSRRRIGILSYSSPGHYYPLTALGRRLQSRGHEVVYFQVADLEPAIRAAGLEF